MNVDVQMKIKSNLLSQKFLRENSYWYKYLNRNKTYFNDFNNDLKEKYKLTTKDRVNEVVNNIDKLSKILDMLN